MAAGLVDALTPEEQALCRSMKSLEVGRAKPTETVGRVYMWVFADNRRDTLLAPYSEPIAKDTHAQTTAFDRGLSKIGIVLQPFALSHNVSGVDVHFVTDATSQGPNPRLWASVEDAYLELGDTMRQNFLKARTRLMQRALPSANNRTGRHITPEAEVLNAMDRRRTERDDPTGEIRRAIIHTSLPTIAERSLLPLIIGYAEELVLSSSLLRKSHLGWFAGSMIDVHGRRRHAYIQRDGRPEWKTFDQQFAVAESTYDDSLHGTRHICPSGPGEYYMAAHGGDIMRFSDGQLRQFCRSSVFVWGMLATVDGQSLYVLTNQPIAAVRRMDLPTEEGMVPAETVLVTDDSGDETVSITHPVFDLSSSVPRESRIYLFDSWHRVLRLDVRTNAVDVVFAGVFTHDVQSVLCVPGSGLLLVSCEKDDALYTIDFDRGLFYRLPTRDLTDGVSYTLLELSDDRRRAHVFTPGDSTRHCLLLPPM